MDEPGEFLLSDFAKFDRGPVLHVGFAALEAFVAENDGALPKPGNDADAAAVVAHAKRINDAKPAGAKIDDVDPNGVVTLLAKTSRGYVNPMCAMFGGVIGQEVVKAARQVPSAQPVFTRCRVLETLEELLEGCRYDSQIVPARRCSA